MLITAALHHPPVWFWCWAALGLWAGERVWRITWFLYTNGIVGGVVPKGAKVGNMGMNMNTNMKMSRNLVMGVMLILVVGIRTI